MKNVIGNPARKENFFFRKNEIIKVTRSLDAGNNIQIAAPRRVGKSSILFHFYDNPLEGYCFTYIDVENVQSKNEYYKKLYNELLKNEHLKTSAKLIEQIKNLGNGFLKKLKGVKILEASLEFNDDNEIDYHDELLNLIQGLELNGIKIVMMIDEFPEAIINIIEKENGNTNAAIDFLQSNRAIRNNKDIQGKLQFIYTGSNSLNITVSRFNSTSLINDLNSLTVDPLMKEDAIEFLNGLFSTYNIKSTDKSKEYILTKIDLLIPFFLQLIVQEIVLIIDDGVTLTEESVDLAFEKIIELRNQNYFDHYITRLKRLFKDNDLICAREILCTIAKNSDVNQSLISDIASRYDIKTDLNKLIEILMYDGYITLSNEKYTFNSPILKLWWLKYECN